MDTPFSYATLIAGSDSVSTTEGTIASGENLAANTPLGMVTATGKLVIRAPGAADGSEKAVRMTVNAVDATAGDVSTQLYKTGTFNVDLVELGAATAAQKLTCFVGTPISLQALV
jgi:hypothetical protein